jgi:transglutaminase-like putative cysteine protease
VFLDPHVLRFHPRPDGTQRVDDFQLQVDPAPEGLTPYQDCAGNVVTGVWFNGVHSDLEITARCRLTTTRVNLFDYLPPFQRPGRRLEYDAGLQKLLAPAIHRTPPVGCADPVKQFAEAVYRDTQYRLVPFLILLNTAIFDRFHVIERERGAAWCPARTWSEGCGACRDLAVLLVDACRAVGLAARFVSGYRADGGARGRQQLHAWAEVYIPGAGWRGFDPTEGLAVGDRHVVIAAALDPPDAAPVSGSFRGTGITSELESTIQVDTDDPAPRRRRRADAVPA